MTDQQPQCVVDMLWQILQRQRGYAAITCPQDAQCAAILEKLEQVDKISEFRVLFLGGFGSGKSSLINGLLGAAALPTRVLPCTRAVTEIRYGAQSQFTVYPKNASPFAVQQEELPKLFADGWEKDKTRGYGNLADEYHKLEVRWPAPALRDGAVFVDTPGLSQTIASGEAMRGCLYWADVVVYTCRGTAPFTRDDVDALGELRAWRPSSVLIACTGFDQILCSLQKPAEVDKYREHMENMAAQHAGISRDSLFFLSTRDALKAAENGDQDMLRRSGIPQLQRRLVWHKDRILARRYLPGMDEINRRLSQVLSTRALQLCLQPQPQHSDIAEVERLKQCVRALEQQLSQVRQQVDLLSEA